MLNEPTQTEQEIDAAALKKLCDMGFPQNRAKKALLLNRYVYFSKMYISLYMYIDLYHFTCYFSNDLMCFIHN